MRWVKLAHRHQRVVATLAIKTCLLPIGLALAQTADTQRLQDAWMVGEVIERACAEAAAATDPKALDAITGRFKQRLSEIEKRRADLENGLKESQEGALRARTRYRVFQVQQVKAQEEIERAHSRGQPKTVTDPLRTRLANVEKDLAEAQFFMMKLQTQEYSEGEALRRARATAGLARVFARTVEICTEKRRAELEKPIASNPTTPAGLLAAPFSLAGTWGGACGSITVGGTFTVNVAKGGAVSGKYIRTGGGSGTLAGTLGPDGKLAAGGGKESDFTVRWVGNVVPGAARPSGTGTWSGNAGTMNCGGSWKSTGGQPA